MNIITTPKNYQVAQVEDVFIRLCKQCGGSGEYSFNSITGDTFCYRCMGVGYMGKEFSSVEEAEKACVAYEKAAERREAKRQAELEAGAEARRAEEAELEAKRQAYLAEIATWKHLQASIGDKVNVTGTVSVLSTFENNFGGYTTIVVIETAEKENVKMFTGAGWVNEVSKGDVVTIAGTVSGFGDYEGVAQTTLKAPKRVA